MWLAIKFHMIIAIASIYIYVPSSEVLVLPRNYATHSKLLVNWCMYISCSYETTGNNSLRMHHSISSRDVKECSTGASVKDVQLEKEEDIEYHSGHLYHSSGSTSVKITKSWHRFSGR